MHVLPPQNLIVIALVSSHHLSITVAALDPRAGEDPRRHKEYPPPKKKALMQVRRQLDGVMG
jgi:hypothetical protein